MICPNCKTRIKDPGKVKGGEASRRELSSREAKAMVARREEKRRQKHKARMIEQEGDYI